MALKVLVMMFRTLGLGGARGFWGLILAFFLLRGGRQSRTWFRFVFSSSP